MVSPSSPVVLWRRHVHADRPHTDQPRVLTSGFGNLGSLPPLFRAGLLQILNTASEESESSSLETDSSPSHSASPKPARPRRLFSYVEAEKGRLSPVAEDQERGMLYPLVSRASKAASLVFAGSAVDEVPLPSPLLRSFNLLSYSPKEVLPVARLARPAGRSARARASSSCSQDSYARARATSCTSRSSQGSVSSFELSVIEDGSVLI